MQLKRLFYLTERGTDDIITPQPIKSVRGNGPLTTQQPAMQGANAVPMG